MTGSAVRSAVLNSSTAETHRELRNERMGNARPGQGLSSLARKYSRTASRPVGRMRQSRSMTGIRTVANRIYGSSFCRLYSWIRSLAASKSTLSLTASRLMRAT